MNSGPNLVAARLVNTIAKLIIWFASKCNNVSNKIGYIGYRLKDKAFMLDTRVHISPDPADEIKDSIIVVQVRKGGCKVQTGNFRRVDCSDNLERSKKHAEYYRDQAIKNTNSRVEEIRSTTP